MGMGYLNIFSTVYFSYCNEQLIYLCMYIFSCFLLSNILLLVSYILSPLDTNFEKLSSYECGFEPFSNGQLMFNIQFFVVGILFMIFDLELVYLFPFVVNLGSLSMGCYLLVIIFICILIIGFIYEWNKGALDWV